MIDGEVPGQFTLGRCPPWLWPTQAPHVGTNDHARVALHNFDDYGKSAAEMVERAQRLIALIVQDLKAKGG